MEEKREEVYPLISTLLCVELLTNVYTHETYMYV